MLANVAAGRLDAAWGIKLQGIGKCKQPLFIAKGICCSICRLLMAHQA